MAEITIGDNHRDALTRMQHLGEWLATERTRLEDELRHVAGQARRVDDELVAFLRHAYGVDARHTPVSLDTERGVIVTPDEERGAPPPAETSAQ